jgi:hypothetical protein
LPGAARLVHPKRLTRTIWQGNERRQDIGDGKHVIGAEGQRGKQFGLQPYAARERSSEMDRGWRR